MKANVGNEAVTCMTIWGNHSNTQYPDFTNAKINGKPATETITDRGWLETTFVPQCQNRGAASAPGRPPSSSEAHSKNVGSATSARVVLMADAGKTGDSRA